MGIDWNEIHTMVEDRKARVQKNQSPQPETSPSETSPTKVHKPKYIQCKFCRSLR